MLNFFFFFYISFCIFKLGNKRIDNKKKTRRYFPYNRLKISARCVLSGCILGRSHQCHNQQGRTPKRPPEQPYQWTFRSFPIQGEGGKSLIVADSKKSNKRNFFFTQCPAKLDKGICIPPITELAPRPCNVHFWHYHSSQNAAAC